MTGPTPEQSQAILSAAGERYVRGESPFDLRLLIVEEAWQIAQSAERERIREQVEQTDTPGPWANGEPISDYDVGYNDALDAVLALLGEPSMEYVRRHVAGEAWSEDAETLLAEMEAAGLMVVRLGVMGDLSVRQRIRKEIAVVADDLVDPDECVDIALLAEPRVLGVVLDALDDPAVLRMTRVCACRAEDGPLPSFCEPWECDACGGTGYAVDVAAVRRHLAGGQA